MTALSHKALALHVDVERFPLKEPFRITGHTMTHTDVVKVSLERDGVRGRGEASGVYYRGDDVAHIVSSIEAARSRIEAGVDRESLQQVLPIGGARNAVDCALWDLESKLTGQAAWQLAKIDPPRPLITTFTVSAKNPEQMAVDARAYSHAQAIKLKLTGQQEDAARVRAVREARPDVWLGVDANQGFTRASLQALMPVLLECGVALIEQPFVVGHEAELDGLRSSIRLAADESAQGIADLPKLLGRFDVVNIKLDKCGGLTEGLAMARAAAKLGLGVMVGNMLGTSLAMVPSYVLGQLCDTVDLDGPIFLSVDRSPAVEYINGMIHCPEALWGTPQ